MNALTKPQLSGALLLPKYLPEKPFKQGVLLYKGQHALVWNWHRSVISALINKQLNSFPNITRLIIESV